MCNGEAPHAPLLATERLHVAYGAQDPSILCDLTLALRSGERVALLGANGSGKTTCLLALAALLPIRSGRLLMDGEVWTGAASQRRRWRPRIGLLVADPDDQLLAPIVRDDLAYGVRNASFAEAVVQARVRSVLHALMIDQLAERTIDSLSLGERKRVAIAGVLALEPDILLLDEPTANLDRRGREGLQTVLGHAAAGHRAICIATHDTRFAARWANRAVILENGQMIADGAPHRILHDQALLDRAWLDAPD